MPKPKKESIMVLCAHSDDQILGVGGTLAKYAREGREIVIIIFSFGEKSHPWLQKKHTIEMRVKESLEASKVIGVKKTLFFGIEEGRFQEEIAEREIEKKMLALIEKHKPTTIFTHSDDDPHSDHRAVASFTINLAKKMHREIHVYSFDVWNVVNISKRDVPKLYIDISDTFTLKRQALKCFKSQKIAMLGLMWGVYWRAIRSGNQAGCRFAEVFYKVQ